MGSSKHLFDCSRHIVQYVVFKSEIAILITWYPPVEHKDIEAMVHQVLYQAIPRHQIQHIGPIDECIDQQNRNRMLLFDCWLIVVKLRLVLRPDNLFRCLPRVSSRSLKNNLQTCLIFLEVTFNLYLCIIFTSHFALLSAEYSDTDGLLCLVYTVCFASTSTLEPLAFGFLAFFLVGLRVASTSTSVAVEGNLASFFAKASRTSSSFFSIPSVCFASFSTVSSFSRAEEMASSLFSTRLKRPSSSVITSFVAT